jgi:hypothetical protein
MTFCMLRIQQPARSLFDLDDNSDKPDPKWAVVVECQVECLYPLGTKLDARKETTESGTQLDLYT